MRKASYRILLDVAELFKKHPNKPFTINEVSKKLLITWKSAKKCINVLYELGLIDWGKLENHKRKYWMIISRENII